MQNLLFQFISQLNTREIAISFYLILFLVWTFFQKNLRESIFGLIKAFTPFLGYFIFQSLYLVLCIFILWKLNFWEISLLKDTILVFITYSFTFLNIKKEEMAKDKNYFIKMLIQNLSIIGVIEIVTGLYTFPLFVELVLVPFLILVGMLKACSDTQEKYKTTSKFFNFLTITMGLIILIFSFTNLFQNPGLFLQTTTVKSFFFPFLLILMFLPVLYFLNLYVTYEWYLVTWKNLLKNMDKSKLFNTLKWRLVLNYHINLYGLFDFHEKNRLKIHQLETFEDVRNLFK